MKEIIKNFQALDINNKALIYLMQIFLVGNILGNTFLNVFYYTKLDGILGIIEANAIFYIAGGIGSIFTAWIIGYLNKNMKLGFYAGFLLFALAFGILYFFQSPVMVYVFSIIFGLANGTFWCSYNSYQLGYIGDKQRDFFASISTLGKNILSTGLPFIISIIFLLTQKNVSFTGYDVIFLLMPLCYLSCLFFIHYLPDIFPKKTSFGQVFSFFHPKEIYQNLYFIFSIQATSLPKTLVMILIIYILKTEINLGIYQTILGILSILTTGYFTMKRNTENRLQLLWTFCTLNGISFFLLGIDFNIISLTLFSLASIVLAPAFDISQNVFLLKYMSDNKKDDEHFLPKMMFREVILIIGRTSFYIAFGYLFYLGFNQETILKIAVYYIGFVFLFTALFAQLEENRRNIGVS